MRLASPTSAILSAVMFNAVVIVALIPLARRGARYNPVGAAAMLRRNLLIYGLGDIVAPFVGIKLIDLLVQFIPEISRCAYQPGSAATSRRSARWPCSPSCLGSRTRSASPPSRSYTGGKYWKTRGRNVTYGAGTDLVPLNVSAQSGFNSEMKISWAVTQRTRLWLDRSGLGELAAGRGAQRVSQWRRRRG